MFSLSLPVMVTHQLECTINDTALLSGTLRTYQKAACDDEVVTLRCPQGTIISIQLAQYGKSTPDLCNTRTKQVQNSTRAHGVPCYWPSAAQVSIQIRIQIYVWHNSSCSSFIFLIRTKLVSLCWQKCRQPVITRVRNAFCKHRIKDCGGSRKA